MYGTLALTPKALGAYEPLIGESGIEETVRLAAPLRGLRVLHLSATAFGTGVAELLHAAVPLLSDIGLDCHWQVVRPAEESASANKALYRALAGSGAGWSSELEETWLRYSAMNADLLTEPFDVIVMHDPQPVAIRSFASESARSRTRWVFHSHLDLSSAEPAAWQLLRRHMDGYDSIVFDAETFVHPDLRTVPISIIRPAIDPLGPRNMEIPAGTIQTILDRLGVATDRPLLFQMAPCDPSSDILGAIDVLDRVRRRVPGAQLVVVVMQPPEDPDSITYFDECVRKSMEYSDVHLLRGVNEVGNVEANAFQRAADVVIQKGWRKGFALWISDAQWKERPAVAARTAGLTQQVIDNETGFLADTTEMFAERTTQLLQDRQLAHRFGEAGRRHVAKHFLLTRFLNDELRLFTGLVHKGS